MISSITSFVFILGTASKVCLENWDSLIEYVILFSFVKVKISNEIQCPHVFFFTLLVMVGNYEPTCIVTIKW